MIVAILAVAISVGGIVIAVRRINRADREEREDHERWRRDHR